MNNEAKRLSRPAVIAIFLMSVTLAIVLSYIYQKVPARPASWASTPYIAHACGDIEGHHYTNSREALLHTLSVGGACAIEMDLRLTSDGRVVCCHSWTEIGLENDSEVTYDQFMSSRIEDQYTPMDLEEAVSILSQAKAYLVVDARAWGKKLLQIYQILRDTCRQEAPDYLPYIIPQIYRASEYEDLEQIYHFSNYILTLYRIQPETVKEHETVADQCLERGVATVTMMNKMASREVVDVYTSRGLKVAVHTIDDPDRYQELIDEGVSMVYTNVLFENAG